MKRKVYDAEYHGSGGNNGDFEAGDEAADAGERQLATDWEFATEYYPDLAQIDAMLAKTSKSLAFSYRLHLITEKSFAQRHEIATAMHEEFLRTYFGANPEILSFAKVLIESGRKDVAKALNRAVSILGSAAEPGVVIRQIRSRFDLIEKSRAFAIDEDFRATKTERWSLRAFIFEHEKLIFWLIALTFASAHFITS